MIYFIPDSKHVENHRLLLQLNNSSAKGIDVRFVDIYTRDRQIGMIVVPAPGADVSDVCKAEGMQLPRSGTGR